MSISKQFHEFLEVCKSLPRQTGAWLTEDMLSAGIEDDVVTMTIKARTQGSVVCQCGAIQTGSGDPMQQHDIAHHI